MLATAVTGDLQHRALLAGSRAERFRQQARLEWIHWLFAPRPGERVLDAGCGEGVLANQLASYGASVLGVDIDPDAVAYAARHFGREGVEFRCGGLDEAAIAPGSFDRATCLEGLTRAAPDPRRALDAVRRALRPGGHLLLAVPNAAREGEAGLPPAGVRALLERCGFEVRALGTTHGLAPFFASRACWRAARLADRLEWRLGLPFGERVVALAARPME